MNTDALVDSQIEEVCTEDPSEINSDIQLLSDNGIVESVVKEKLKKHIPIKRIKSSTISMYSCPGDEMKSNPKKFSPFLAVEVNMKTILIRKTTAVWLFQEGERVSSNQ